MDPVTETLLGFVGLVAFATGLVAWMMHQIDKAAHKRLAAWLLEQEMQLLDAKGCWLRRGPFRDAGKGVAVLRFTAADGSNTSRRGWARIVPWRKSPGTLRVEWDEC